MAAALYALIPVIACQDGNQGMTAGDETPGTRGRQPVDGCYPDWAKADNEDPEGLVAVCSGSGNGWFRTITSVPGSAANANAVTRYNCVQPPLGVKPEALTEAHCIDNPIDLETLGALSGGAVPSPEVCCAEVIDAPGVMNACENDCAHAACRLAVLKLEEAAAGAATDATRADLLDFANFLATPLNQATCVTKILEAAPGVMAWPLGEGVSDDELGHIESLTLSLQCDVTATTTLPDACDESANTPDSEPAERRDGFTFEGAVSFFGLLETGSTAVSSAGYTVTAPTCRTPPCAFELTHFDVELESFGAGRFEFIDPQLQLARPAGGWRDGVAVELPIGALQLAVSTAIEIDGEDLFGERRFVLELSNTEAVSATLSKAGAFTIQQAAFNLYGEHALLNID